jgi:putative protease
MAKAKSKVKIKAKKTLKVKKEGKLIGKITHYFSNIEVAVINLSAPLKVGDTIRVIGGQETDFNQEVESMQIDHKAVKSAKKGDSVGMEVDEKVHEGYKVYKI